MSETTKNQGSMGGDAPQGEGETPPSKRRVLLYAAAPVVLLILLMVGVRFATDAAQKMEAAADASNRESLKNMRPSDPKSRPTPVPITTSDADKATQAALEIVVRGQLQAIGQQDFEKALTYATPEIRKSGQPEQFGDMIRRGYSAMLAAKKITVLPAKIRGMPGTMRQAFVETEILTISGERARYRYVLVANGDKWRVGGVIPDPSSRMDKQGEADQMPRQESPENFRDL